MERPFTGRLPVTEHTLAIVKKSSKCFILKPSTIAWENPFASIFFKMPTTIPSRAVSAPYLASIWALASFLAALAALARTLRLRDAKSLCLRALGFAPALFLPALCLAFDVH